jgi:hypothetical protein
LDRRAARRLADLVLDDVSLPAERRAEHERVNDDSPGIGEKIVPPSLDVVDATEG